MDSDRAKELLAAERSRIEQALAELDGEGSLEAPVRREPGDEGSEDLYQDAAGTYGRSTESGEPIPDERLGAIPTAERTVEEQERYERR